jgi:hypothetical protein
MHICFEQEKEISTPEVEAKNPSTLPARYEYKYVSLLLAYLSLYCKPKMLKTK